MIDVWQERASRGAARSRNGVILSGEFGGGRVAYLGTERDLGVTSEIFSGTPGDQKSSGTDP
jgi:hypothetical protein